MSACVRGYASLTLLARGSAGCSDSNPEMSARGLTRSHGCLELRRVGVKAVSAGEVEDALPGRIGEVRVAMRAHARGERNQAPEILGGLGGGKRMGAAARKKLLAGLLGLLQEWRVGAAAGRDRDALAALPELSLNSVLLHAVDEGNEVGFLRRARSRTRRGAPGDGRRGGGRPDPGDARRLRAAAAASGEERQADGAHNEQRTTEGNPPVVHSRMKPRRR